jgi:4-hydroxybenzoate polyprenyltransferase
MIIHFITILRPLNLLITLICILLSALIIDKLSYSIIPLSSVILLLAGFANIINDIFDYKIDQANRLNRPLSSGSIKRSHAIIYAILLLCISLVIIFNYNFNTITKFLILCINLPLMIFYTPIFKKIPLIGNMIVSFILGMVFIVTTTYLKGNIYLILPPATLAFLLMVIREMVKDIADLDGDKKFNIKTLPVTFGINYTFKIIIFFSTILITISLYFTTLYNLIYFIFLLLLIVFPLLYYLYQLSKNKTATYCIYLSKVLKLITIFGVIVIYLASI